MKTVLIIDDEENIRSVLKDFLEQNECKALTAESVEEGNAVLRNTECDMLLLDIHLPDGNGLSMLQQLKKLYPNLPVIMITGQKDLSVAEQCLECGASDYIAKPFDFEYLRTSVLVNLIGF